MLKAKLNFNLNFDVNREQVFAVGGFCALLLICAVAIIGALQTRANALQHLAEQHDRLAALEAHSRPAANKRARAQRLAAPATAFLDASTSGLATAQLQAYLSELVTSQHAVLVSSGVPADRDDKSDAIKLQISLNATLAALQTLLYRLESGAPYVFVDALLVQPGGSTERTAGDPVLKVNLTVHAFWRRRTA
ncbi:type II secretion system protein GspM [Bradyrhizobium mercantei]|uniref:type II secretion system protein GspM n=1 Tax=Bradyrhizobium mercantei TaxID=1904807 RepID=UPI0013565581|nr:type II secretion system protein GspM [Bradyrhizobium mercantei]